MLLAGAAAGWADAETTPDAQPSANESRVRTTFRVSGRERAAQWNAYGDTVGFVSEQLRVVKERFLTPNGHEVPDSVVYITPYAVTLGTPIAITARPPFASMSRHALLDLVLEGWPSRSHGSAFGEKPLAWSEPGRYGRVDEATHFGWSVIADARRTSALRMLFVVFGRPDSSSADNELRSARREAWADNRRAGDPMSLKTDLHLRPFEVSAEDVRSTARFVGDVVIDLATRSVSTWDSAAAAHVAAQTQVGPDESDTRCAFVVRVAARDRGVPLADALVRILSTRLGALTDSLGMARFEGVECWEWPVEVKAGGYDREDSVVWLRRDRPDTLFFRLKRSARRTTNPPR